MSRVTCLPSWLSAAPGAPSHQPESEPAPTDPAIVLVYEDMTAALYAVSQLFRLRSRIPDGFDHRLATWNFAMLDQPDLRERIAADLASANLVVVAASNAPSELPTQVAEWLRATLGLRSGRTPCAVAPVFHNRQPADEPTTASLRWRQVQRLAAAVGARLLTSEDQSLATAVA